MKLQKNIRRIKEKEANRNSSAKLIVNDKITAYGGNFNVVENSHQAAFLIGSIAANAGKSAASEAKALRMPKIYANTAKVIVETADGKKTVVATATADNIPGKKYYQKYTPGTIMHVVDK